MLGLASSEGLGITGPQLDLAFDLDGDAERQLREADRAARMSTLLLAKHADDQVSEPVDNCRLACEPWR